MVDMPACAATAARVVRPLARLLLTDLVMGETGHGTKVRNSAMQDGECCSEIGKEFVHMLQGSIDSHLQTIKQAYNRIMLALTQAH
ncbi:MAG: hypothetical protein ACEQSK_07040 [Sphingomonadaceae bacterium]